MHAGFTERRENGQWAFLCGQWAVGSGSGNQGARVQKHVPECSTSSSPGGLPGICAARFRLPAEPVWICCNLRFRTAPVLARTGGAVVAGAGALFEMSFSGVVEVKNAFMPPPVGAGTSFPFFGMLPCSTNEGSDFFWREISGVKFGCSLHIFLTPPPLFFGRAELPGCSLF